MTPQRWREIEQVFADALRCDPATRITMLADRCGDDAALRTEVNSLIAAHGQASSFIEHAAFESVPRLPAPIHVAPGRQIGPYRVLGVLGVGGMGVVYEAEQSNPRRTVALKVIRTGTEHDERRVRLFQREADSLARLKHPSIAAIYDAGRTAEGEHYFAMELVRGEGLTGFARRHKLSLPRTLELFTRVCDAISYAHQRGVIHRDLKPSNVIVGDDGDADGSDGSTFQVKVLDFGLARVTDSDIALTSSIDDPARLMGTLPYMSPEQTRGQSDEIDVRSDVYSLGVVLYELVTGSLPYDLREVLPFEALGVIRDAPPRRPTVVSRAVPGEVETILLKALEKEPERRYQSVAALADDIGRYQRGEAILARPPSGAYQLRKLIARHKLGFAFATTVVSLLAVLAVVFSIQSARIAGQRDAALAAQQREAEARGDAEGALARAVAAEQVASHEAANAREQAERAEVEARRLKRVQEFLQHMLASANPSYNPDREVTVRELVDRAAASLDTDFADQPEIEAELRYTLGQTYRGLGLNREAKTHLRRALELRRELYGEEHADVGVTLLDLANVLSSLGSFDAAEKLAHKALGILERAHGPQHSLVASCHGTLGDIYRQRSQLEEAEGHARHALEVRRAALGDRNELVARDLSNLSVLLGAAGKYDEARELAEESLDMRRELLGPRHADVATSLMALGVLCDAEGDFAASEQHYREALSIFRERLGDRHPHIASALNNLAMTLRKQERLDEAEPLYHEALALFRDLLGPEHPEVANTLHNLSEIARLHGDAAEAESLLRESIAINRKALGDDHPAVAIGISNLAGMAMDRGDLAEAERLFREALVLMRSRLGGNHPNVAIAVSNVSAILLLREDYAAAVDLCREALELHRGTHSEGHPMTVPLLFGLAESLRHTGQLDESERYWRELLAITEPLFPASDMTVAGPRSALGEVLVLKADHAAAEPLLRQALAGRRAEYGGEHWKISVTASVLGAALTGLERYEEAEPLLLDSLDVIRRQKGDDSREGKEALDRVVALYEAWGKPERAREYRALPDDATTP